MRDEFTMLQSPAGKYGDIDQNIQHAQALINALVAMAAYDEWGEGELKDTAQAIHGLAIGIFDRLDGCISDFLQASDLLNKITDTIIKSSATSTANLLRDDEALMRIRDLLGELKGGARDE